MLYFIFPCWWRCCGGSSRLLSAAVPTVHWATPLWKYIYIYIIRRRRGKAVNATRDIPMYWRLVSTRPGFDMTPVYDSLAPAAKSRGRRSSIEAAIDSKKNLRGYWRNGDVLSLREGVTSDRAEGIEISRDILRSCFPRVLHCWCLLGWTLQPLRTQMTSGVLAPWRHKKLYLILTKNITCIILAEQISPYLERPNIVGYILLFFTSLISRILVTCLPISHIWAPNRIAQFDIL